MCNSSENHQAKAFYVLSMHKLTGDNSKQCNKCIRFARNIYNIPRCIYKFKFLNQIVALSKTNQGIWAKENW